jgi:hypothetical protein
VSSVLVPMDGLLRNDLGAPFMIGQALYKVLAPQYRVCIASPMDQTTTENWMRRHGLLGWSRIHNLPLLEALAYERVQSHIHFVVTPDEDEARAVFAQGITVMLIAGSDFVNPKWRAERPTWGEMMKERL